MVLPPTLNTEGVESDSLLNGSHHENHPPSPRYPRCPDSQATLGSQVPQPLSWLPHAGQALYQDQEISRSLENTDILIFKKSLEKMLMQRKRNEQNEEKKKMQECPILCRVWRVGWCAGELMCPKLQMSPQLPQEC